MLLRSGEEGIQLAQIDEELVVRTAHLFALRGEDGVLVAFQTAHSLALRRKEEVLVVIAGRHLSCE